MTEKRHCQVVIIGAGACGLQCARILMGGDSYSDLLILEARDRVGGRIHSVKHQMTTDKGESVQVTIDHGAAWVHGTGYEWPDHATTTSIDAIPQSNPMMELLTEATKNTNELYTHHLKPTCRRGNPWMRPKHVLHDADEIVFFVGGQRLDPDDPLIQESLQRNKETFRAVSRVGNEMHNSGDGMETATTSLQQVLDRVDESNGDRDERLDSLIQFHRYLMTVWYGCPLSELQLSEFTDDKDDDQLLDHNYTEEGDFLGPHCTLRHGMQTVLEPLLSPKTREHILLNQEVICISDNQDTVLVTTRSGLQVQADCCVVTIPIGCLQQDDAMFQPPLSANKTEAIHAMRMGGYKKVLLTFDRIFWPTQPVMIGMVRCLETNKEENGESPLGNFLLFDNLWASDGIACIEAILTCDAADWATGKDDTVICKAVLHFMGDAMSLAYSNLESQCIECHVTRWEEDQYSRGAYSSYKLGTLERHTEELRTPEWNQKLFFAGEGTIPEFEGSVHAALFSGRDVADRVQEYLKSGQVVNQSAS